jgi:hypothetical protein
VKILVFDQNKGDLPGLVQKKPYFSALLAVAAENGKNHFIFLFLL